MGLKAAAVIASSFAARVAAKPQVKHLPPLLDDRTGLQRTSAGFSPDPLSSPAIKLLYWAHETSVVHKVVKIPPTH
jgi:hypothetical protein